MEETRRELTKALKIIIDTCKKQPCCTNCPFYAEIEKCGFLVSPENWLTRIMNIKKAVTFAETVETIKEDQDEPTKEDIITAGNIITRVCREQESCFVCPFQDPQEKGCCSFDSYLPKDIKFGVREQSWSAIEKIEGITQ